MEIYDIKHFLAKFSALDEKDIGQSDLINKCALWHCGVRTNDLGQYIPTDEAIALAKIFGGNDELSNVSDVNDNFGNRRLGLKSTTPKGRLLEALRNKMVNIELKVDKEEMQLN